MKVNQEKLLIELVSRGIDSGFIKSYVKSDNPSSMEIKNSIFKEVMSEINKYFYFESVESMREKYPANVDGSKEFNDSISMEMKSIPKIDRRIEGC
jgi:hypothetical protein